MIRARKRPIFNLIIQRWVSRMLRRRFHGVFLAGDAHLKALRSTQAVVGCVNHTNWWDGFVLYVLSHKRMPHDIYLAMDEQNLRRYRFFTWMGVFGVDLSRGATNIAPLRYSLGLLRAKNVPAVLVWMFVQGALVGSQRPVECRPGACFLAREADALLLPLALRYHWLGESRPSIFIRVGAPLPSDTTPEQVAAVINDLLEETDRSLDPPQPGNYRPLFPPRKSVHTWWDEVRCRARRWREIFDKPVG